MDYLIVDGYNVIGSWDDLKELKKADLGQARDRLVEYMADYQAYTGVRVIVIFDAQFVPGMESKQEAYKIEVIYTKKNETADECIEKIVTTYKNAMNQVYVATSDYMEQRITFGRGALRKSARELLVEVESIVREIDYKIITQKKSQPQIKIPLNESVLQTFEKWRRRK
ncbi:MAG TPA: NYN domain-containing protein [Virgibacillus sp.]|jgi:predicted RNA-binding protein with PIN domain|nr:NYN domain-containing protein [Virgibacillus sp.]